MCVCAMMKSWSMCSIFRMSSTRDPVVWPGWWRDDRLSPHPARTPAVETWNRWNDHHRHRDRRWKDTACHGHGHATAGTKWLVNFLRPWSGVLLAVLKSSHLEFNMKHAKNGVEWRQEWHSSIRFDRWYRWVSHMGGRHITFLSSFLLVQFSWVLKVVVIWAPYIFLPIWLKRPLNFEPLEHLHPHSILIILTPKDL